MIWCKHCGNKDKETLEEVKPKKGKKQYNFIIIFCKKCLKKCFINVDD